MPAKAAAAEPRRRAVEDAADRLRSWILDGRFSAGTLLPGERDLSARLDVSRLTLGAALTRLESEGLVRKRHGAGNLVLDFRESGTVELIGHLVAGALAGGSIPVALFEHLLELRRMFAVEVVGLVAKRATLAEISELEAALLAMTHATGDSAAFMAADLRFSRSLVRATHNLAFQLLANTISRVLENHPGVEAGFGIDPEGTVAAYASFLPLIAKRKPVAARRAARERLGALDAILVERLRTIANATGSSR